MRTNSLWTGVAMAMTLAGAEGAVIYRETFGIAPGATADQQAFVFDWQRFNNQGIEITTTGNASGVNYTVNGRPIDVANVNAGPNNDGTFGAYANGILYLPATPSPNLAFTTEYTVDPSMYEAGSIVFSFYEGNAAATQALRVLIRVGFNWYVSSETFSTAAVALAAFGTASELKTLTFNPAAANWLQLSFDGDYIMGPAPGQGQTVGSGMGDVLIGEPAVADLTGPITAFGVFGEGTGTGNRRIDSFMIEATPLVVNPSQNLTWTAGVDGNWDSVTDNWKKPEAAAAVFVDGDEVTFDDTGAIGTVNLVTQVTPLRTTVNNSTVAYSFEGNGSISGSGAFTKRGTALLKLVTENNLSGTVTVEAGILQLGDGGTKGSVGTAAIVNNGQVIVNRAGTVTMANAISGAGRVVKNGPGTLVMTGDRTYKGITALDEGALVLNNANASSGNVSAAAGTVLAGTGFATGLTTVGGKLSPGTGEGAIGTLNLGRLTMETGATLELDLTAVETAGDLAAGTGALTLNNNRIVANMRETPRTGVPYAIVTYAANGRQGTFDPAVTVNGANRYTAAVSYDDAQGRVLLTFAAPEIPAQVIYRETFGIAPGATADVRPNVFDWARFDSGGLEILSGGSSAGVNFSAIGRLANVGNVNAGPNNDGTLDAYANGILYFGATPNPSLGFTTEYAIDPANYAPGSIEFSWYVGNNTAPHQFRLLLRVGTTWYASAAVFTSAAVALTAFETQAELKRIVYNPARENWLEVFFDGNYVMGEAPGAGFTAPSSLGPVALGEMPAADLSGAITAFGVYGDSGPAAAGTGNRRLDTFTVEAAPLTVERPRITTVTGAGGRLTIAGRSTFTSGAFRVLASGDLTAALNTWTEVATGAFAGDGSFTVTVTPTGSPQFYVVQAR